MRYMIMHKTNAHYEAGGKPPPELIKRVGGMIGELQRAGVLVAGEGLGPSSAGMRFQVTEGDLTVSRGPFSGEGALPARYAIFSAETPMEAADIAKRFREVFGDVIVDLRTVNEPWDLGFAPEPEGLTTRRYMVVASANDDSEADTPLSEAQVFALGELGLTAIGHFEPSSRAKRLKPKSGVLDGPFTESKELIGGFVIVDVSSIDDAVHWAQKYLEVVDTDEVDVRGIASAAPL